VTGNSFFEWPIRVYFEGVDSGGIVYYASYLKFMERVRIGWFRCSGIDVAELVTKGRVLFVVKSPELDYRQPTKLSGALRVSVILQRVQRASLDLLQEITYDNQVVCARS